MHLVEATSPGFPTIMDQEFNEIEVGFDRVATEYARRKFGELDHKLVGPFASRVQRLRAVCHQATSNAICPSEQCGSG
jgi:hypothetical protein